MRGRVVVQKQLARLVVDVVFSRVIDLLLDALHEEGAPPVEPPRLLPPPRPEVEGVRGGVVTGDGEDPVAPVRA